MTCQDVKRVNKPASPSPGLHISVFRESPLHLLDHVDRHMPHCWAWYFLVQFALNFQIYLYEFVYSPKKAAYKKAHKQYTWRFLTYYTRVPVFIRRSDSPLLCLRCHIMGVRHSLSPAQLFFTH